MKVQNVDLVLVVDASDSMGPCFGQVLQHLTDLLSPLQQANFRVRFGLVAYAAGKDRSGAVYDHTFVGGRGPELLKRLYDPQVHVEDYFAADPRVIERVLGNLKPGGNEDTLLALDIAADFPFGPAENTRRVIAVFCDEKLEDGISGDEPLSKLPEIIEKLQQRRIQLFVAAPFSPGLEQLAGLDRAVIEPVDGGDGLKSVDFKQLFGQMGKSISMSSLQMGSEPVWKKAIFGQDRWSTNRSATEATRQVVLSVGESARLNTSEPLTRINVKLQWTRAVDLDLHAFLRTKGGQEHHIYFVNKTGPSIQLDVDAGVGNRSGQNEENLTMTSLDDCESILFATNIFKFVSLFRTSGCYADYDGLVTIQTNTGDDVHVPLTTKQRGDWCVIAKITNSANQGPTVVNVNKVTNSEPTVGAF